MGRLKCQVHAKRLRRPLHSKDTPIKHKNSFRRVLSKEINVYGSLLELSELEESKVPAAQGSLLDKGLYCSLSHPTSALALETVAGLEHDTSISYEVSDESCSHAASTTCTSSLPSPEVFRSGCDRGTPGVRALRSLDFSIEEEPLDLCSEMKNSTLLDVSHAKNIHMQQPLDLSTIKGTSSYSPVRENQSSESKGTIVESERCSNHLVSDWNFKKISPKAGLPRGATPVQRGNKKVRFTSPVSDVITRPPGAVQICSPGSRGTGEPDRPVRPGRVTARLFRFAGGRDAFFRIVRERVRCSRLRVPSFLRDVTRGNPHAEVPSRGVTC